MGSGSRMGGMFGGSVPKRTPGIGDGLGGSDKFRDAFSEIAAANAESGIARPDPLASIIGKAPQQHKGGFGDVLQVLLAVGADATDPQGRGIYTKNLAQQWGSRREAYEKSMDEYKGRNQIANLPGMNQRELAAYSVDPKSWASNMSKAATSRYDAATLNPGDTRTYGEGQGSFQAPTRGQQYAKSLNLQPGTPGYETAIRDQELGAQGPTGFQNNMQLEGVRQSGRVGLENLRQTGRTSMEGIRQGNRMGLRSTPTYRDLNPPPPRVGGRSGSSGGAVTATNPQTGEKMMFVNGKWIPAR